MDARELEEIKKIELNRTDDKVFEATTNVVKSVMVMINRVNERNTAYVDLVKVNFLALLCLNLRLYEYLLVIIPRLKHDVHMGT